MKRFLGILCLIAGFCLVGYGLYQTAYNFYEEKIAGDNAQEIIGALEAAIGEPDTEGEDASGEEDLPAYKLFPDMEMPTITINGYRYIGTLEIPGADLVLPVMEEWDYTRLNIAPCRYSGSAYKGDLIIAGHDYSKHFTPIKSLLVASPIIFTDADGNVFNYRVSWTEVLKPSESDVMESEVKGSEWDLTLFTCTVSGSERFTVRCVLEE